MQEIDDERLTLCERLPATLEHLEVSSPPATATAAFSISSLLTRCEDLIRVRVLFPQAVSYKRTQSPLDYCFGTQQGRKSQEFIVSDAR
jgi:hypothetical protein